MHGYKKNIVELLSFLHNLQFFFSLQPRGGKVVSCGFVPHLATHVRPCTKNRQMTLGKHIYWLGKRYQILLKVTLNQSLDTHNKRGKLAWRDLRKILVGRLDEIIRICEKAVKMRRTIFHEFLKQCTDLGSYFGRKFVRNS